ncbi:ligand-binding sensor domain-containing protein [Acidicapsa ligni]|uniref:ligand-binding sensor domain-containing protein n=1 Tax=Acidicapsa ligni TaxID=542300 RepID=UPI0021E0D9B6|nr:sensor histidine kinase [Acidicapsa ligni]
MSESAVIARASELANQAKSIAVQWARWMRWAQWTLLFLLTASPSFAQSHTLEVSQYLHTSWTSQEGFFKAGISAINSVAQTSDGYLWIAGSSGLLRFDGVRFVEWKPPANDSLPRRPLHRLLGSRDGSLWISGIGLAELKANGEFRRYHQLDSTEVEALYEDKDGGIWAAGAGQASILCRFYRGGSQCFPANSPLGTFAGPLHEDEKGQLWICTSTGIWKLRPGSPQKVASVSGLTNAYAFDQDANGTLVFTTGEHMNRITADGKIQPYPIEMKFPRTLLKDRDGDLWIGTGGQGIVHVHEGRADSFTTSDGLSSNSVVSLFQDREGNVWAGTGHGLDKFTKPAVPSLTSKQGLSIDYVNSVLTDRKGVTWIGTRDGLYQLVGGRAVKSTVKLPSDLITSLFETSKGRMLVGINDPRGLVWLDGSKASHLRVTTGENVFEVAEGKGGDLWLESGSLGLMHLNEKGDQVEDFKRKIGGDALAFDSKREGVWVAFSGGGLRLYKDGKIVERYGTKAGLGEGIVRDPQVDEDGGVWAGTRVGLAHVLHGKLSMLNRKNGLPCDAVHWMRHDRDHNVWLYTECGLVAFPESELVSWIAQPSHTVAITHYLMNTDGVESVAYNGWYTPQASITNDGRIVFATTVGLSILDPRSLNQNASPPPVHIEEITADERDVSGKGRVSLPVNVRSVRIAFTALSFAAPRRVLFRYKLQNFDKDWSSPDPLRQATYTNLPPGKYEFKVMACNNDGVWNTTGDTLSFAIPPAFYQTIWFKVAIVGSVAGLLWVFYLLRLRSATAAVTARLGERLQERERIARDLHDTLLQDFQAVTLRFQVVSTRLEKEDPRRLALEEGLDHADQVLAEGRNHIRDIRADTKTGDELSESLTQYGNELSQLKKISFSMIVNGSPYPLDPIVRDEIHRIGREAIGNSFKHSNGTRVETVISYGADQLQMKVYDDGIGLDSNLLSSGRPGHWGIQNMRERARKIGANFEFSSEPNGGTLLVLEVPVRHANTRRRPWHFVRSKVDSLPKSPA